MLYYSQQNNEIIKEREAYKMAIKIAITLQKGGVGKTSTALALASELGRRGKKVLLIDADAQADSTYSSGYSADQLDYSLFNVLTTEEEYKCSAKDAILKTKYYDVIPADNDVNDLVRELNDFYVLKNALAEIDDLYEFIIIDCPPALSIVTSNVLVACDHVIIPSDCRTYSFLGILELKKNIDAIKEEMNPKLNVLGVLLVKFDRRTTVTKQLKEMIEDFSEQLDTSVYSATIRNGIAVEEAELNQVPLCDYVRKNNNKPYIDYKGFVTETLKRLEMK